MGSGAVLSQGTSIERYEILTRLSVGGMAELFLAAVRGPGGFRKFVVLKRILPHLKDDADFVAMFLGEAQITAALSHSNIAQVFDLGESSGELFLVMEFIAGQDLSSITKAAARARVLVPVGLACRIIRDVCRGLYYAHTFVDAAGAPLPIIHRDLSARNVMVTYAGNVKIIDFGVAKAKGMLERTQKGLLKGSAGYMSPEQVLGQPLDGRSDLFAAAVLLYEMLTGTRLFRVQGDERASLERILTLSVPVPHEVSPRVSPDLSAVVTRALARDKEGRFANGKEMARAIEAAAGPESFDDETTAAFMKDMFADRIQQTRELLQQGAEADSNAIQRALGRLTPSAEVMEQPTRVRSHAVTVTSPSSGSGVPPISSGPAVSWVGERGEPRPPNRAPVVLAVDDSNVGRKLAELHLSRAGFQVVTASSAEEALEVLAEMRPDAVLLDVVMPGMDGFELCHRIREIYDTLTPVIFVSAACSIDERARGLAEGGDDFLRKPYDPGELVARIHEHLRRAASVKAPAPT